MNKLYIKIISALTLIATLAVAGFFWNEARKEIVFLCGNFNKGLTEKNVRKQLDTGNFLSYQTEQNRSDNRIIVYSTFTLSMYTCIIELDSNNVVLESHLE